MFNWKSLHGLSRALRRQDDPRLRDDARAWNTDDLGDLGDIGGIAGHAALHLDPAAVPFGQASPGAVTREEARAALIDAFNPSQPVEDRSQLFGRQAELERVFSAIADLRGHALIYGARGTGKTSLARAFGDYADERGLLVVYLSCDGASNSFADIFRSYLEFLPDGCFGRGQAAAAAQAIADLAPDFGPRALASVLARVTEQRTVLIIDEFDRVTDVELRHDMATLLKLLSDMRSQVHLLFVGIARDVHELIAGHASVRRHLVAIGLRLFGDGDVHALLDEGERRCGLTFDGEARALLAWLAGGSPYHLRLFAFSAGLTALHRQRTAITPLLLVEGLHVAFENWASVNPETAALFEHAARTGAEGRRRLEALAVTALGARTLTAAALADRLRSGGTGDIAAAAAAIALVRPALVPSGDEGGLVFGDTLAPQFLLLSCCFAADGAAVAKETAA